MKKAFILLFTFSVIISLTAQIEWIGDFGFSGQTKELYKTKNNQFIVIRVGQDDSGFSVLDSTGNLIFNYSDPYHLNPDPVVGQGHIQDHHDFIEMADSTYLFILFEEFCVLPNDYSAHFRLVKFDQNWDELDLNDPIVDIAPGGWVGFQFLAPLPNNTFHRVSDRTFESEKRDCDGNIIWSKMLPYHLQGYIRGLFPLSGDTTALISWDSIHLIDNQGEFVHSFKSPTFDNVKTANDGKYFGQDFDTLFILSPSFLVIDHISFSDPIQDFALTDSALVVLTTANEIYIYDDNLHLQNMFDVDGEYPFGNYPVAHLAAFSESFLVAGNICYGINSTKSILPLVKEYPLDGDVVYDTEDIGVTAIETIGSPSSASVPPFGDYQLVYDSLKITVHNFGDNVIDSLKLNAHFPPLSLEINTCPRFYQMHHNKYTGTSLMPGQSMDFYWEDFSVAFEEIPVEENFNVCIWSSLPNQKIDRDSENDVYCTDFLVADRRTIPTGFSWSVFPNPVYDYLNIQLEDPMEGCNDCILKVTDISGRERYRSNVDKVSQNYRIPVWDWEAGIYFLQYLSDGGVMKTSRFVVVK